MTCIVLTANQRAGFSLNVLGFLEEVGEVLQKVTEDASVILEEVQTVTCYQRSLRVWMSLGSQMVLEEVAYGLKRLPVVVEGLSCFLESVQGILHKLPEVLGLNGP